MKCPRCGAITPGATRCTNCEPKRPRLDPQDPPGAAGLLTDPSFWHSKKGLKPARITGPTGERHWLVPPFGSALRLDSSPGSVTVIGRDDSCDLRIASPTVSRRHAELRFKGLPPRAYVKDLNAVNQTLVNGERIQGERQLADNDVLRLGEVTAIYRLLGKGVSDGVLALPHATLDTLNATIPLGQTGQRQLTGITGDIEAFPLAELLGRLTVLRATGTFVVEVDGMSGRATLKDGALSEARFAGREGNEAVRAIAELRRGRFRFVPEAKR